MPNNNDMPELLPCREAFEKWITDDGKYPHLVERLSSGNYQSEWLRERWISWQAAWNTRADKAAESVQDVDFRLKQEMISSVCYRGYEHGEDKPETYKLLKTGAEKALEFLTHRGLLSHPHQAERIAPNKEPVKLNLSALQSARDTARVEMVSLRAAADDKRAQAEPIKVEIIERLKADIIKEYGLLAYEKDGASIAINHLYKMGYLRLQQPTRDNMGDE